jgi:hypothetical protein
LHSGFHRVAPECTVTSNLDWFGGHYKC